MARQGFFDSTTVTVDPVTSLPVGDKAENSDFLADTLYTVLGNGVSMNPTSNLLVQTNTGLIVTLKAGRLWKNGYKLWEETDRTITFTSSASEQTFYISGRLDVTSGEFTHDAVYPYTTFDSNTDVCVAKIVIPANALTITDAMITDYRYNTTYCGIVDEFRLWLEALQAEYEANLAAIAAGTADAIDAVSYGAAQTLTDGEKTQALDNIGAVPYGAISSNLIINGGFSVNQRGKSGTVTLSAGAYGHDRWKAGASGCTYTFATSENVTTLTISAGSLLQVVEGLSLQSGAVCLSWTGTAQGKIGAGDYGNSGITGTATGGTNLNIEFGTGTLSLVQLNYGSVPLTFVHRPISTEVALCGRYALPLQQYLQVRMTSYTTNYLDFCLPLSSAMRVMPSISGATLFISNMAGTSQGGFTFSVAACNANGARLRATKNSHGLTDAYAEVSAAGVLDAEL